MTNRRLLLSLLLLLGLAPAPAVRSAAPQELVSSLTLDQAVNAALTANAQLHALRAKWEAMQERPVQARSLANPMFKYSAMDSTAGGTWPNTDEKRLMIEQEVPWFGKLALRGKIATTETEAMQREYEAQSREVVMLVKESYFDLYAVQRAFSFTHAEEEVLQSLEQIARSRYGVGAVPQQDVLKAQSELALLKQRLFELDEQEAVLKARLNQLLNRPADSTIGLAVTEPQHELELQAEELLHLAGKMRPEIKQAQADVQRSQYERDLRQKEFFPDYRVGLEYRNMATGYTDFSNADNLFMVTIGFDLPIWQKKYRAGVREADKLVESSQANLEAVQRQTSFDVQDAWFKLQSARQTLALYQTELIPQAAARFKATEASYRTGKLDFSELLESQRFLLNTRVMAAMTEGSIGRQLGRLERAVGADLPQMEKKK